MDAEAPAQNGILAHDARDGRRGCRSALLRLFVALGAPKEVDGNPPGARGSNVIDQRLETPLIEEGRMNDHLPLRLAQQVEKQFALRRPADDEIGRAKRA